MNIEGKNGQACIPGVKDLPDKVVLRPSRGFPVIRALIVDITIFFKRYHSIKPWLVNDGPPQDRERLQSSAERDKLNGGYECILCAC